MKNKKTFWIVTNSNAGVLSQALGLTENMGITPIIKHVQRRFPFSFVPPFMKILGRLSINFVTENTDKLEAPWPDVVIACGAQSVHFCLYIKEKSKCKTFCIYLQDPKISSKNFDLVIKMAHDTIQGDNVLESNLSLNRVTKEKLEQEKKKHSNLFKKYKKPFFAILIGGSTKKYKMTKDACEDLINQIKNIKNHSPQATLLITPSRRTPEHMIKLLNDNFAKDKQVYIADLKSQVNPYIAMLAVADKIFVTNDSVNMMSEACSANKEVYLLQLKGFDKGKPITFSDNLIKNKIATVFKGKISDKKNPTPTTINETKKIAEQVKKILIKKKGFSPNDFKS